MKSSENCLLCGNEKFKLCYHDPSVNAVTSDVKLWQESPKLYTCLQCGHLQKLRNPEFAKTTEAIYQDYHLFDLSGTSDQVIFHPEGPAKSRSEKVLDHLRDAGSLPSEGKMLDVGCGNGAMLSAAAKLWPHWQLYGYEPHDDRRARVLALPGVKGFYCGKMAAIPERFDLITLSHVFEHIDAPALFLADLKKLLTPQGLLLIQIPDITENPIDMMVMDHYSHFAPEILRKFVTSCGFQEALFARGWVHKEMTLGVRSNGVQTSSVSWWESLPVASLIDSHDRGSHWLQALASEAKSLRGTSHLGIFGTAIAGTWIAGILGEKHFEFFVDEDINRIGKTHLNKPVKSPNDLTEKDTVFLAFPSKIAEQIAARHSQATRARFIVPPSLVKT